MKKFMSLFLILTLCVSLFAACGKEEEAPETDGATGTTDGDQTQEDVVTLKWIQVGNGMPSNYDAWQKSMNAYLAEKIGVNIDVQVVSWGDWDNRRSVIANSGEDFDILFTDSNRYNAEVNLGLYADITDLIQTSASDLYNYIPEAYWDAVSIDGKIYGVPTYKDSSATQYVVWDKAMVDKYDVDYKNIDSFEAMTEPLTRIKEGENTAPFMLYKYGSEAVMFNYDQMGVGLPALGVRFDDESRQVVNVLQQEDIMKSLTTLHEWYDAGIINADAPTLDERSGYRIAFTAQGWSTAAQTTWGPQMGVEAVAHQLSETIVSNTTVRGSLNGVSASSKHPEKALEFLQLINTDSKVRDAFYYGLEGENYEYDENGKVVRLNDEWSMAGYTQGTFFNVTPLASAEVNEWEEVKALNDSAKPSVLLGFNLDTSNIESELANCRAIYEKYRSELLTGARDPQELTTIMTEELNAAGFETVIAEAQSQVDAQYNQ